MGNLTSNGIVYLVNPAGLFFGANAVINVGQLYAVAGHLGNEDFLANQHLFTDLSGEIFNHGTIEGSAVHLFGKQVWNYGTILVGEGTVVIAVGDSVFFGERDGPNRCLQLMTRSRS